MDNINVILNPKDLVLTEHDEAELKNSRARKRVYDLLVQASSNQPARYSTWAWLL